VRTEAGTSGEYRSVLTEPTDSDAIAASIGDGERFALIFDRHFEAIHGFLHRRVGRDAADELAAETFAEAFRRRDVYDAARADVRPWLFGIAVNLLRHHVRTERRQLLAYARTGNDPVLHSETEAVEARVDADAARRQLALGLASLRTGDRDVLLLYAWADLGYQEISQALRIPIGTVRSRLHRARRRVRELLEASGQPFVEPLDEGDRDG
jgi:RNA polymerase sigma factor (sigma-70 family)